MSANHARLKKITNRPATDPIVAVAITINDRLRNSHTGILYRDVDNRTRLLHLIFHYDLVSEPFNNGFYLCADPGLEVEDAKAVAAWCRLIANNPSRFPVSFAIHYNPKATITKEQDVPVMRNEGKGLNCSTFVLLLFNAAAIQLVNFDNWPQRPQDAIWHQKLLTYLKPKVPDEYYRKVAKDIGCARVRPEEVAGACLEPDHSATFAQCEKNGLFVLKKISEYTGLTPEW